MESLIQAMLNYGSLAHMEFHLSDTSLDEAWADA